MPIHNKLFIPGPSEVRTENLLAMATPQIGHRTADFKVLYDHIQPKLQQLLYTKGPVFTVTSSAFGVMEGSVRNLCHKKCINFSNGAFAKKWHSVTKSCGIDADIHEVEWGKAIKPEMIEERLSSGKYDCMTLVSNETSTGVLSPLAELAEVWKKYPEVSVCIDAVSAMAGTKIEFDALGLDVLLAGMQKCFALPSGLTVCAVSPRSLEKSKSAKNKGYYFDFIEFQKSHEKSNTPTTPAIPHLFALKAQLDFIIDEEGLENRWARHEKMAKITQDWALERGFKLFAEDRKYCSKTLTCVDNREVKIDVAGLNKELKKHYAMISNGYKDLKELTFRIAHMGDCTLIDLYGLLRVIDDICGFKS